MATRRGTKSNSQVARRRQGNMRMPSIVPEISYKDTTNAYTSVQTGVGTPLSAVALGDGVSDRDGASIHPVHLKVRLRVGQQSAADTVRVVIVRLLYDQTGFNVNQILESVSAANAQLSDYNYEYHGQSKADQRFEVLYDQSLVTAPGYQDQITREIDIPMSTSQGHSLIRYPSSGLSAVPVMGGLMLCTFSTQAFAVASAVAIYSRLQYIDA